MNRRSAAPVRVIHGDIVLARTASPTARSLLHEGRQEGISLFRLPGLLLTQLVNVNVEWTRLFLLRRVTHVTIVHYDV